MAHGPNSQPLLQALDTADRLLEIPLVSGNIASDQRSFAALGFPAVGLSVEAAHLYTPEDTVAQVQPEALYRAASLLLTTLWLLM